MKLIINGQAVEVSGGSLPEGSIPVKSLTEEEYDNLSAEDKKDTLFVLRELPAVTRSRSTEFVWWSPHMTSGNTPTPYEASASSAQDDYYAWKAFDGDLNDCWENSSVGGDPVGGAWLKFSFGSLGRCCGVRLYPWQSRTDLMPTFTLQGSADHGSTWSNILTTTSIGDPTEEGWYEYLFNGMREFDTVRFVNMMTSEKWSATIADIEFLIENPVLMSGEEFRLRYEDRTLNALPEGTVAVKPLTKAEYDALSDSEKQSEVMYAITDDNSGGEPSDGSSGEVYSTEETRIGTWIGGKPLYRRVYSVVIHDQLNAWGNEISIPNISLLVGSRILVSDEYGFQIVNGLSTQVGLRESNIYVFPTHENYLSKPARIIIEYTKTTDTGVTT